MNNSNGNKAIKWIAIVAAIGVATGAAVGLLYAPKEGKDTRSYLKDKTIWMKEQAKNVSKRIRSNIPVKPREEAAFS